MYTIIKDGSLNMCASYPDNIEILIRHKIAHSSIRQSGYFDVFFKQCSRIRLYLRDCLQANYSVNILMMKMNKKISLQNTVFAKLDNNDTYSSIL